jgi:hypothetical protein
VPGQLMPAGELVIVPAPVVGAVAVTLKEGVDEPAGPGVTPGIVWQPGSIASAASAGRLRHMDHRECEDFMAHDSIENAKLDEVSQGTVGLPCFGSSNYGREIRELLSVFPVEGTLARAGDRRKNE